jgi:hypothetical protein
LPCVWNTAPNPDDTRWCNLSLIWDLSDSPFEQPSTNPITSTKSRLLHTFAPSYKRLAAITELLSSGPSKLTQTQTPLTPCYIIYKPTCQPVDFPSLYPTCAPSMGALTGPINFSTLSCTNAHQIQIRCNFQFPCDVQHFW